MNKLSTEVYVCCRGSKIAACVHFADSSTARPKLPLEIDAGGGVTQDAHLFPLFIPHPFFVVFVLLLFCLVSFRSVFCFLSFFSFPDAT